MENEHLANNKFITVAGRAASMEEFAAEVRKNLFDNYAIVAIHELGELGIDDKERYLAFITGVSMSGKTFFAQKEKLLQAQFGAYTHDSQEEAFEFSKEEYPAFTEKEQAEQIQFEEMKERFPSVTAFEVEQFNILEALWAQGKIRFIRCRFDDEPALVLVAISVGSEELRVRPLALLMNENVEAQLEFPNPDD